MERVLFHRGHRQRLPGSLLSTGNGLFNVVQNIYSNKFGLADAYGEFWGAAATLFNGNANVLGFGLCGQFTLSC